MASLERWNYNEDMAFLFMIQTTLLGENAIPQIYLIEEDVSPFQKCEKLLHILLSFAELGLCF